MNSIKELYDQFGIVTEVDSGGMVTFSGVGKCLAHATGGETLEIVRRLMVDAEKQAKDHQKKDNRVVIKMPRQIVVLYQSEVKSLLERDPDLYMKALKRGKSELRYRVNEERAVYAQYKSD